MNINLDNYESFLVDYVEGQLSSEQEASLMQFLENHPELDVDLELDTNSVCLPKENESFDQKSALFRNSKNGLTIEQQIIALVEGDCTEKEKSQLLLLLSRWSDLEKEYALFRISKLRAENTEYPWKKLLLDVDPSQQDLMWAAIFEGDVFGESLSEEEKNRFRLQPFPVFFQSKSLLKKGVVAIPIQRWVLGLSTAAALLIAIFFVRFRDSNSANAYYADKKLNIEFPDTFGKSTTSINIARDSLASLVTETKVRELKATEKVTNQTEQSRESFKPIIAMDRIQAIGMPKKIATTHRISKDLQFFDIAPVSVLNTHSSVSEQAIDTQPIKYTSLGEFITAKVKEELNLPKKMTAKDGINRLIDLTEAKLSSKSKREVVLEAPKKGSEKRSWNLRFGKLAFQRG